MPQKTTNLTLEMFDAFNSEEYWQNVKLRKDHPWVYDLIRILFRRPEGLDNQQIYREMRALRPKDLPVPKAFDATIRSALNSHHGAAKKWAGNPQDDLFYQPRGRGSWAVYTDRAFAWVEAKGKSEL